MEYPKINSLWKRDLKDKKGKSAPLIVGDYACEEFGNVKHWRVDEKLDGCNLRIYYLGGKISFAGRTSKSIIQPHLLKYLHDYFTPERLAKAFPDTHQVILYGEGYGVKIQAAGSNYRQDVGFILFDVLAGRWWLKRKDLEEIAKNLEIPIVPNLGVMTEKEIIEFVKSKPLSKCSEKEQVMEGVVCRAEPLTLFRNGNILMFKLKVRDFGGIDEN